jgi:hypothetical protein
VTDNAVPEPADVICRRELTRSAGGRESPVVLTVLRPEPDGNAFACEIRVTGLGPRPGAADADPVVMRALGIDAVQALLIAFQGIRLVLRPYLSELAWLGTPREHGIPLIVSFLAGDSTEFYEKVETVVERESERFMEKYIKKMRRERRTT